MKRTIKITSWMLTGAAALTLVGCGAPGGERIDPPAAQSKEISRLPPTRTGYVSVKGARFYYQVYGDLNSAKTPLLVLHGSFMSSEAMAPLIEGFSRTRPVIAFDARGHGRTGDLPGPFTYEQMAADAAGVLDALKVPKADVFGYSMGAVTAITMAIRFPQKVGKQIIVSGVSQRVGWIPEIPKAMEQITPAAFAGGPLEAEYKRLSPTPNGFHNLVDETRQLETANYDLSDAAVKAINDKTMIIVGDTDAVQLNYAVKLFGLRGGGGRKAAAQGFLPDSPRARLAILPATAHIGIMANGALIAELALPFLDDKTPVLPPGFLK